MGASIQDLKDMHIIDDLDSMDSDKKPHATTTLVDYARESLEQCLKEQVTFVKDGVKNIPKHDFTIYREEDLARGIGNILKCCRNCKYEHFDDCIVNVIRSCYEVALFGEAQYYSGTPFDYLVSITGRNLKDAHLIMKEYRKRKKLLQD